MLGSGGGSHQMHSKWEVNESYLKTLKILKKIDEIHVRQNSNVQL